jgi:SAM-dependent methyltransferase
MSLKSKIIAFVSPVKNIEAELSRETKLMLENSVSPGSNWLDLGCGQKPFISSFANCSYTGIDVEVSGREDSLKSPDVFFDGIVIPFASDTFDGILCTQVLEHVINLELTLSECNRVLKPGGVMVISVPFLYREHEQPFDFRRFTSFGITSELEQHGFKIEKVKKGLGAIPTIAMLTNSFIAINFSAKRRSLFIIGSLLITINLGFSKILAKVIPDNGEIFSVLIVKAEKVKSEKNGR